MPPWILPPPVGDWFYFAPLDFAPPVGEWFYFAPRILRPSQWVSGSILLPGFFTPDFASPPVGEWFYFAPSRILHFPSPKSVAWTLGSATSVHVWFTLLGSPVSRSRFGIKCRASEPARFIGAAEHGWQHPFLPCCWLVQPYRTCVHQSKKRKNDTTRVHVCRNQE